MRKPLFPATSQMLLTTGGVVDHWHSTGYEADSLPILEMLIIESVHEVAPWSRQIQNVTVKSKTCARPMAYITLPLRAFSLRYNPVQVQARPRISTPVLSPEFFDVAASTLFLLRYDPMLAGFWNSVHDPRSAQQFLP